MRLLFLILFLPFTLLSQSNYNLSLLGTYDNYNSEGNDIWGWVAPDGSEYALVGLNDGFSVVNVSNPSNPDSWMKNGQLNESRTTFINKYARTNSIITEILCAKGTCPVM